jgi:hypothetical protein
MAQDILMMLIWAILTSIGFLLTAVLHIVAPMAQVDTLAHMPDVLTIIWLGVAVVSCLAVLWLARAWSLAEFWENLTDDMPWLVRTLLTLLIAYVAIILFAGSRGQAVDRVMNPATYPAWITAWQMTGVVLALYALPLAYAWSTWWAEQCEEAAPPVRDA